MLSSFSRMFQSDGRGIDFLASYALFVKERKLHKVLSFVGVGIASAVLIAIVLDPFSTLGGQGQSEGRDIWQLVVDWWRGSIQSSLLSLLGFRRNWDVGLAVIGLASAALVVGLVLNPRARIGIKAVAFGLFWLFSAYALQAIVRSDLGTGQAMSYRYTYHGMIAATFAVAAVAAIGSELVSKWPRGSWVFAGIALVAMVPILTDNAVRFSDRTDVAEREFFELNRQEYVVTRAQMGLSSDSVPMLEGPVLGSLHPSMTRRDYVRIVSYLARRALPESTVWRKKNDVDLSHGWLPVLH